MYDFTIKIYWKCFYCKNPLEMTFLLNFIGNNFTIEKLYICQLRLYQESTKVLRMDTESSGLCLKIYQAV